MSIVHMMRRCRWFSGRLVLGMSLLLVSNQAATAQDQDQDDAGQAAKSADTGTEDAKKDRPKKQAKKDQPEKRQDQPRKKQSEAERTKRPEPAPRQRGDQARQTERQPARDAQAWLGVMVVEADGDTAGARITQVFPAGPAARAGLRRGDLVTKIKDQKVRSAQELIKSIEQEQPGDRTSLAVMRNGSERQIEVKFGRRSDFLGADPQMQEARRPRYPEPALGLEFDRRLSEQNQRIERLLLQVLDEVEMLREEVEMLKKDKAASAGDKESKRDATGQEDTGGE